MSFENQSNPWDQGVNWATKCGNCGYSLVIRGTSYACPNPFCAWNQDKEGIASKKSSTGDDELANAIHDLASAIGSSSQLVGSTSTRVSGETLSQGDLEALEKMKKATDARERVVFTRTDLHNCIRSLSWDLSRDRKIELAAEIQRWLDKRLGQ